jgi:hypothetical protein
VLVPLDLLKETTMLVIAEGVLLTVFVILSLATPPAGRAALTSPT